MNYSLGFGLFALKFLLLAFIVMAFWPPFSYGFVTLSGVGVVLTCLAIAAIIKKNSQATKFWTISSIGYFVAFSLFIYLS